MSENLSTYNLKTVISGFHHSVNEIFTLLRCYAAPIGLPDP
jgi:hypothetical protein